MKLPVEVSRSERAERRIGDGPAKPVRRPVDASSRECAERRIGGGPASERFGFVGLPGTARALAHAAALVLLCHGPATAQSSPEAFVSGEWQRFMSTCGPILYMDDAKFAELGQRQAQLAGKTEDGKMVAFVSEDPTNSFSIIVAEGPEWYAIDCEVFRYGGLPFPADALANVLSAMVSASGEMKIVGGATLEAQAGTMLVRNSYNFAIWGALPQPGTVLTLEIANDTFAFDVTTSIPKAQ